MMQKRIAQGGLIPFGAAALFCLFCLPAAGQKPEAGIEKPVTFKVQNVKVRDALDSLFKQAGVKYRIDPAVPNDTLQQTTSFSAVNSTLRSLLDTVLRLWGLTYRVENDVYVIASDPAGRNRVVINFNAGDMLQIQPRFGGPGGGPAVGFGGRFGRGGRYFSQTGQPFPIKKKVSLDLKDVDARAALKTLFDQDETDYLYALDGTGGGKVTLSMGNAPFEGALLSILRSIDTSSPLTYRAEYGIVTILPDPFAGGSTEDLTTKRVTMRLKGADLNVALRALFMSVQGRYTLDQAAHGTVTVSLSDVPFRKALETILDGASPPLDYTVEDGTFRINQAAVPPK